MNSSLIYIHDPMCSWCWGFEPVRQQLFEALAGKMQIRRLVGGLAPDSDQPMPVEMQKGLQQTWQHIEEVIPGTRFNYAFWSDCAPRRSTYPSNRAVIAARQQGEEFDPLMTARIQKAYYLEAKNPSDDATLIELAADIGLDAERFADSLASEATHGLLLDEIASSRAMGVDSFPSLVVEHNGKQRQVQVYYTNLDAMLEPIEQAQTSL